MRQTLPLFHAEPDPKIRGEYISIAEKLYVRCEAAISRICNRVDPAIRYPRQLSRDESPGMPTDISRYGEDDALYQHVTFVQWYYDFITSELQPTGSYQRHVTALKVLRVFIIRKDISNAHVRRLKF